LALLFFLGSGLASALGQRPLGTDVSDYQPSVNWTAVKNGGVTFAWTKATEGTYYVNSYFVSQETGAKSAGIYIGAYHYARPSIDTNITGALSADTEAAYFWSTASNYVKSSGVYLVPMLDWEDVAATNGHNGLNIFTAAFMSQWVNEWCNTVSNLAHASGVTLKPVVYTGTWYSNPANGYAGLNTTVTNWPSWIASYPSSPNPQSGAPPSSYPWPTWNIWQYADTNWSGGDADVFNGTSATLISSLVIGGVAGPSITSQPLWRAADTGGSVTFSAAATGSAPLSYQWQYGGAAIAGATNASYMLTNAHAANTGGYALVVTNASGSVTSSPSWLVVYPPQATLFADNFDVNTATNWILNKSSTDTVATFSFDYSTLGIPSAPNSTNGTTRGLQMKANLAEGVVAAVSLSPTNQSFAGDYRLRFDAWINVNGPFPGGGNGSTEFLTAGLGTSGTHTEWASGAATDGYYFAADGDGGVSASSTTSGDYCAYSNATLLATSSGAYIAGTDSTVRDNANAYYTSAFPVGQAAPALQQTNYSQQTGSLNTGTFGFAWHDVIISRRGKAVDWVVDGVRLAYVASATFTASNVCVGFWDQFPSLSDNNTLSFGLVDNVRVEVPAVAPVFTTQPLTQAVRLGTNATLTAAASGLPAPVYQWQFNGTNIAGATNTTYALAFVAATNAGTYALTATNVAGGVASSNALLSLVAPAAARFQSISVTGAVAQISFTGDPYWTYTVDTSTNLTGWNTLTNLVCTNGMFQFNAEMTTGAPQQFFRARVGP
jgi:GH25 family lysozyme M1 (1,4-beta-N-acetylmuramidase)